mgnify:CR=1 FL=1
MFDNIKINDYSFFDLPLLYYFLLSQIFPFLPSCPQNLAILSRTILIVWQLIIPTFLLRTKLHSIRIWFLMNLSANPNIFSLSTCGKILCYDYRINNSIPAMLVFVLTSGCNSNCITFLELNWLSVDQRHILVSNSWINKLRHDDQLILQFKKDSIFYSTFVLPYL